jgi:hypothetical protein
MGLDAKTDCQSQCDFDTASTACLCDFDGWVEETLSSSFQSPLTDIVMNTVTCDEYGNVSLRNEHRTPHCPHDYLVFFSVIR